MWYALRVVRHGGSRHPSGFGIEVAADTIPRVGETIYVLDRTVPDAERELVVATVTSVAHHDTQQREPGCARRWAFTTVVIAREDGRADEHT